jgi:hypothetical protein
MPDQKSRRPEMRGPTTDVSDMMSRLKTKTINIQPTGGSNSSTNASQQQDQGNSTLQNILSGMTGSLASGGSDDISLEPSVINVSSLGNNIPQESAPHKSKRRTNSAKNTVSMDL